MKLLFDQNLSYKLKNRLKAEFPDSTHVSDFKMTESDDMEVWDFARAHKYTIVTCDADFFDIMLIKGFPPKVIWIKKGNSSTQSIYDSIYLRLAIIRNFESSLESGCLEIY